MKKRRFYPAAIAAGGVDVTDQKSVDRVLRSRIEAKIDPAVPVLSIELIPSQNFSTTIGQALVTCFDAGSTAAKAEIMMLDRDAPVRKWTVDAGSRRKTPDDGMKFAEVDFSNIAARVNLVAKAFEDEGHDFSGIERYTLHPDPTMVMHEVWANSVTGKEHKVGNGKTSSGPISTACVSCSMPEGI